LQLWLLACQALVCFVFLLASGDLIPEIRALNWPLIIAIFVLIAGPWYAAMARIHGATYIKTFFGYHNLEVPFYINSMFIVCTSLYMYYRLMLTIGLESITFFITFYLTLSSSAISYDHQKKQVPKCFVLRN
jgi:hypothetical protein